MKKLTSHATAGTAPHGGFSPPCKPSVQRVWTPSSRVVVVLWSIVVLVIELRVFKAEKMRRMQKNWKRLSFQCKTVGALASKQQVRLHHLGQNHSMLQSLSPKQQVGLHFYLYVLLFLYFWIIKINLKNNY